MKKVEVGVAEGVVVRGVAVGGVAPAEVDAVH